MGDLLNKIRSIPPVWWIGFLIAVGVAYWFTRGNQGTATAQQTSGVTALAQGQQGTITGSPDAGFTQQLSDYNTNQLTGFSTVEQQVAGLQASQDQILNALGQAAPGSTTPLNGGPNFNSAGFSTPLNNGSLVFGPVLGGTAPPVFNSSGQMVMMTPTVINTMEGAGASSQLAGSMFNQPGMTTLSSAPASSTLTPSQFQLSSWQMGNPVAWQK